MANEPRANRPAGGDRAEGEKARYCGPERLASHGYMLTCFQCGASLPCPASYWDAAPAPAADAAAYIG